MPLCMHVPCPYCPFLVDFVGPKDPAHVSDGWDEVLGHS